MNKGKTYVKNSPVLINASSILYEGGKTLDKLFDLVYPVGSVYISTNATSPATLFGGSWTQIQGRFLVGCGSNGIDLYTTAGQTGGSVSHRINQENLPARTTLALPHNGGVLSYSVWTGGQVGAGWFNSCLADFGYTSDQPITHLPPYLSVYMWYRTA